MITFGGRGDGVSRISRRWLVEMAEVDQYKNEKQARKGDVGWC